ncbi:type III pantothenate kinase [Pelomicrobium methylotrophicum]|uniref:Type III pantothenate kinase n=1 Tax=Pelomicrobium methylotrophicum TaxID=2602750 RepID=A0A5C7EKR6_9PROT|nr:type III pantothenate kinase [Pelomicrobium methylotrophicum]
MGGRCLRGGRERRAHPRYRSRPLPLLGRGGQSEAGCRSRRGPLILAIDAGNTRIKWGLHDGRQWLAMGSGATAEAGVVIGQLAKLDRPSRVAFSNVAGPEAMEAVRRLCSEWSVALIEIVPQRFQCGVTNGYADPHQLGSDRWAAMVAAWRRFGRACLVVNAGTAMTADMVDDHGRFRGGIIVPGHGLMLQALAERSSALDRGIGRFDFYPKNTANAVYSGALLALVGAVKHMVARFSEDLGVPPVIVLAGGDAALLRAHLELPAEMVEHLVLEGIVCIASEGACP